MLMPQKTFKVELETMGENLKCTGFTVPFSAEQVFGSRGMVRVKGTVNGFAYRSTISPMGDGTHVMLVNKAMQQGAGCGPGDTVTVVMDADTAPRVVTVPPELKAALAKNAAAKAAFEKFSYSHQTAYVQYVAEAKRPETRARRAAETVRALAAAKRRK